MPQLDIASYSSQIFWLVITFGLLYILISKHLLSDVGSLLRQRQDRIQSDLDKAEEFKNQAKDLKEKYESTVMQSREKSRELINRAIFDAEDSAARKNRELEVVLTEKLAVADKKIKKAEQDAFAAFTPVATDLSKQIVKKLVGLDIKEKSANEVVIKFLKGA